MNFLIEGLRNSGTEVSFEKSIHLKKKNMYSIKQQFSLTLKGLSRVLQQSNGNAAVKIEQMFIKHLCFHEGGGHSHPSC